MCIRTHVTYSRCTNNRGGQHKHGYYLPTVDSSQCPYFNGFYYPDSYGRLTWRQGTGIACRTYRGVVEIPNEDDDCPKCLNKSLNQSRWFESPDGDQFRRGGSAHNFVAGRPTDWWAQPLLREEWPPRSSP